MMNQMNRGRMCRLPPHRGLPSCDLTQAEFDAESERRRVRLMRECVATEMPAGDVPDSEAGKAYDQIAQAVSVRKRNL